ncbi:MAG: hypothetical protein A2Y23_02590 [Clostridiales bacterium GWB2_37_7]|nr:MAG: hypothetical protein A2Y23_02590 [Clostridiales bacterium GWB2_37_7]
MIIESVGTSLIVGKLRKGRFSYLKDAEIYKWYLIVSAFLIEFIAVILSNKGYQLISNNIFSIHFISYSLLFIGIYFNISRLSFKLIMLGTFLNFIVIMLNGGQMPVSQDAMIKAGLAEDLNALINGEIITHTIIVKDTVLKFLGDIFILPKPYPRPKVFSIGDVFLALGIFVYIQEIMVKKRYKR